MHQWNENSATLFFFCNEVNKGKKNLCGALGAHGTRAIGDALSVEPRGCMSRCRQEL